LDLSKFFLSIIYFCCTKVDFDQKNYENLILRSYKIIVFLKVTFKPPGMHCDVKHKNRISDHRQYFSLIATPP